MDLKNNRIDVSELGWVKLPGEPANASLRYAANEDRSRLRVGLSAEGLELLGWLNTGADERAGEKFACVSAVSGLDVPDDGRGVIVVDWDGDGDQDLWISNRNAPRIRYFRNDTRSENNFVELRLIGNGKTTSRDAVGARVDGGGVATKGAGGPPVPTGYSSGTSPRLQVETNSVIPHRPLC